MGAYIEHVGYLVKDLDWHVSFFAEVYGMEAYRQRVEPDGSRNVWLTGGLQLMEETNAEIVEGRNHHLCLIVDDLEAVREQALAWGCTALPKHHWVQTPDGLKIEMFTALPGVVQTLRDMPKK